MALKKFITGMVPLSQLNSHRCAWKGCTATTPIADDLAPDWRWLALWWGPAGHSPLQLPGRFRDRDAVLCPKHAAQLHNDVLEDIGQRLDQTRGSA